MLYFGLILFFILGTAVGSFLNVVAYRSVHGGSVFFDHSACPHCKKRLKPPDLIPIASYLFLRGRCRYCGKKISLQYPLVELITGLLFVLTFNVWVNTFPILDTRYQILDTFNLLYLLFVVSVLIVLFTTDIIDGLLPNSIVLPAIVIVAIYKFLLTLFPVFPLSLFSTLLTDLVASFLVASGFFAIVYFSGERALGGGDVKLAFFIALAVGWPSLLVALFSGFLTGGLASVMLILAGRRRFGQTVPLGPFLAIGAFVALFYGDQIIQWYLGILSGA